MTDFPNPSFESPAFPPPPPPPSGFSPSSTQTGSLSPGLALSTQICLWVLAAAAAVVAFSAFAAASSADDYENSFSDSSLKTLLNSDHRYDSVNGFYGLATLVVFILLIVFSFQAYKATQSIYDGSRKWSRGWTVGGWFIPFANAIIPARVLIETGKIAQAPRVQGRVAPGWESGMRDNLIVLWFTFYGLGVVLASRAASYDSATDTMSDYRNNMTTAGIGVVMVAIGVTMGAVALRRIARKLAPARPA